MAKYEVEPLINPDYGTRKLPASLLFSPKPLNDLGDVCTVAVVNHGDEGRPIAFGAFNHFAPMLIEKCEEDKPSDVLEAQFVRAFCQPKGRLLLQHMMDALVESTVGELNFDLKKNITVDLYANEKENETAVEENRFWRDYAGFVVSDRHLFREFTINREKLLSIIDVDKDSASSIEALTKSNRALIFDYDATMATFNREEFLSYLIDLEDVVGVISLNKGGQPDGYALAYGSRILQVYGENGQIASALMHGLLSHMAADEVTFYARDARWIAEACVQNATRVRLIRRFHTRIIPAQVKWDRVFAINIGLHVF